MESHIGYSKYSKSVKESDNRRNGSYAKTIIDEEGNTVTIDVPRDRDGTYEPMLILIG